MEIPQFTSWKEPKLGLSGSSGEIKGAAFLFASERQGPLSHNAIHKIVVRAGEVAGIKIPVHAHMLRHGKVFQLASEGTDTRAIQAYLGHKNIQHTVRCTQLDPKRFKGFGKDFVF